MTEQGLKLMELISKILLPYPPFHLVVNGLVVYTINYVSVSVSPFIYLSSLSRERNDCICFSPLSLYLCTCLVCLRTFYCVFSGQRSDGCTGLYKDSNVHGCGLISFTLTSHSSIQNIEGLCCQSIRHLTLIIKGI